MNEPVTTMRIMKRGGEFLGEYPGSTIKEAMVNAAKARADLRWANLEGAYLQGANLEGAYLQGANLEGANLEGAYLEGANLEGAYLRRADLEGAYLRRADLEGANLQGANLEGAYLQGANLEGADLEGANLEGAYLRWANLRRADLEGANLEGADLEGANLEGANLEGANLQRADLEGADEGLLAVPDLHTSILAAIEKGGELNMQSWHTCETTHCRAGWAIVLAGPAGRMAEALLGPSVAGALITHASCPWLDKVPNFVASDAEALADIKRCAAFEAELKLNPAATFGAPAAKE